MLEVNNRFLQCIHNEQLFPLSTRITRLELLLREGHRTDNQENMLALLHGLGRYRIWKGRCNGPDAPNSQK